MKVRSSLTESTNGNNFPLEKHCQHITNPLKPQLYQLKTQLLGKGKSKQLLARTDCMTVQIKCYARGGENVLHAHPGEDHTFIVLAGAARFFGEDGEWAELTRNQGVMLPRGIYYYFQSCGDEPLVLLRVGTKQEEVPVRRIGIDGLPLPGNSKANKHEDGVPIEGLFYE